MTSASRVVLRLSALLLLIHSNSDPYYVIPTRLAAFAMLVSPARLIDARAWLCAFAAVAASTARHWHSVDNHQFLIAYWCLSCGISLLTPNPTRSMRVSARWLICLVFALGTISKLISGEFLNGDFVYVTMLLDVRVQYLGEYLSGLDPELIRAFRQAVQFVGTSGRTDIDIPVPFSSDLRSTAVIASIITVIGEGLVALLFALQERTYLTRHLTLLGFIVLTYPILPVVSFGTTLAILGLAQCDESDRRLRMAYLGVLALTQLTLLQWPATLVG